MEFAELLRVPGRAERKWLKNYVFLVKQLLRDTSGSSASRARNPANLGMEGESQLGFGVFSRQRVVVTGKVPSASLSPEFLRLFPVLQPVQGAKRKALS